MPLWQKRNRFTFFMLLGHGADLLQHVVLDLQKLALQFVSRLHHQIPSLSLPGLQEHLGFAHLLKVLLVAAFFHPLPQRGPQLPHVLDMEREFLRPAESRLIKYLTKRTVKLSLM